MLFKILLPLMITALGIAEPAWAQPGQFSLSLTTEPVLSTNPGLSRRSEGDSLIRNGLTAEYAGEARSLFSYNLVGSVDTERYRDLTSNDADTANYGLTLTREVAGLRLTTAGTHTFIYGRGFDRLAANVVDFSFGVTRPFRLDDAGFKGWTATPGVAVARRLSATDILERTQIMPSLAFRGPFLSGTVNLSASYAFRRFDVAERRDEYLSAVASWNTKLTDNLTLEVAARYRLNASNRSERSYDVFEFGPALVLSFSTP
ncbi:hypothetical protein [Muricoccus pecuniae]|uniref:DUF481 domain-containing protein n=1 Tax=Muricoccus pecuniae TaxID=693023 RepID=A0A840YMV4_9PROT|nr:hypothetical protein [Roseomonas pecuniae]MBB5696463.1 hypothetical protein [Roseomonas pecuniae]